MTHHLFHPFAFIAAWGMLLLTFLIIRAKADLAAFVDSINAIGEQPFAIIVIIIGCVMLVECKTYGLDSTIAGGIIGVGSNMLQNKLRGTSPTDLTTKPTIDPPKP